MVVAGDLNSYQTNFTVLLLLVFLTKGGKKKDLMEVLVLID